MDQYISSYGCFSGLLLFIHKNSIRMLACFWDRFLYSNTKSYNTIVENPNVLSHMTKFHIFG